MAVDASVASQRTSGGAPWRILARGSGGPGFPGSWRDSCRHGFSPPICRVYVFRRTCPSETTRFWEMCDPPHPPKPVTYLLPDPIRPAADSQSLLSALIPGCGILNSHPVSQHLIDENVFPPLELIPLRRRSSHLDTFQHTRRVMLPVLKVQTPSLPLVLALNYHESRARRLLERRLPSCDVHAEPKPVIRFCESYQRRGRSGAGVLVFRSHRRP